MPFLRLSEPKSRVLQGWAHDWRRRRSAVWGRRTERSRGDEQILVLDFGERLGRGLGGLQFLKSVVEGALRERAFAVHEGEIALVAEEGVCGAAGFGILERELPQTGFDVAVAAEHPFGVDHGVDQEALFGWSRPILPVVVRD